MRDLFFGIIPSIVNFFLLMTFETFILQVVIPGLLVQAYSFEDIYLPLSSIIFGAPMKYF